MQPRLPSNVFEGVPVDQLKQWRTDAQRAYNALMTGRRSVEIMADGYMVKYTRANSGDLLDYINQLNAAIAGRWRSGAIGVAF